MTSRPMIISVEGNIGSGKSTLVEKLRSSLPSIVTLQEPVAEWETIRDREGETILTKFYRDQETYAFPFQMMAYISRLASIRRTRRENPHAILVTERSVETDRHVFAQMLHDEGKIGEVEHQIYLRWFDEFIEEIPISATIYVKASPETCNQRIQKRNRKGETIPLDYLERCGEYHEGWLSEETHPVLVLDGDQEMTEQLESDWLDQIRIFIQS